VGTEESPGTSLLGSGVLLLLLGDLIGVHQLVEFHELLEAVECNADEHEEEGRDGEAVHHRVIRHAATKDDHPCGEHVCDLTCRQFHELSSVQCP